MIIRSKNINTKTQFLAFLFGIVMQFNFASIAMSESPKPLGEFGVSHTAWLSLLNKDIGTIGTLADKNPVIQVYINSMFENRFYASLWANIPLDPHNRSRSTEFDFSVGYVKHYDEYRFDFSVALFDLENPSIGDLESDIFTTKFRVDKNRQYFEISHYEGIGARDGWLAAIGHQYDIGENFSLSSNLSYTSGPFNFDTVAFVHSKLTYQPRKSRIAYFLEFTDQLYRENPLDPRRSALLFGVRNNFF